MMEIKILGRYRDRAGTACRAALAIGHNALKARGVALLDRISAASEPWNNEPNRYYSKCRELAAPRSGKLGFSGLVRDGQYFDGAPVTD
jgi:hypothetical protein